MKEFFIGAFDRIVSVIVILMVVGVVIAGLSAMFTESFLAGLFVLIAGGVYVVLMAGFMYLGLGIYENTKRTAEASEKLANRG